MREDIEQLKTTTQAVARLAVRNSEGAVLLNLRPTHAWKNSGSGTPATAIETLLMAADGGDVDTLAASILFDAEAREKAQAILDRLPEAVRATYGTPEKLIALRMARDADIRAMQVLSESQVNNDALVMLRLQKGDGKTKDEGYVFRREGDGWRLVIPGKAVEKYGKKLTDPPKKGG
jgi:thioredoxin-like negative regulator of GroEL